MHKITRLSISCFLPSFQAIHKETGKVAALKQVPITDPSDIADDTKEIDILAECQHENIVKLYDAYYWDDKLWIYIEFCDGGAVDNIMMELEKGLTEPQIVSIAYQMLQGLLYLHDNNIMHRDLKAGNILLTDKGIVKIGELILQ